MRHEAALAEPRYAWPPRTRVVNAEALAGAPVLLTIAEIVLIYRICESTVRNRVRAGTFVAPWKSRPLQWRKVDVERDLLKLTAPPRRPRGRPRKERP